MSTPLFSSHLVDRLAAARRVAVLTGAGISAESGIPTFRDADGLWQKFRPEELANVRAFLDNPVLVQGWYRHRRSVVFETEPNPGHVALAELEDLVDEITLITQNVDNLHQRAGSRNVIELHGNLLRSYCIDCGEEEASPERAGDGQPARCRSCGGLIRPDVVWFGEMLPQQAFEDAERAARQSEVFLSIGTSAVVFPAAGLPLAAADAGAYAVEVNVSASRIGRYMNESIRGKAGEVLPSLVAAVRSALSLR